MACFADPYCVQQVGNKLNLVNCNTLTPEQKKPFGQLQFNIIPYQKQQVAVAAPAQGSSGYDAFEDYLMEGFISDDEEAAEEGEALTPNEDSELMQPLMEPNMYFGEAGDMQHCVTVCLSGTEECDVEKKVRGDKVFIKKTIYKADGGRLMLVIVKLTSGKILKRVVTEECVYDPSMTGQSSTTTVTTTTTTTENGTTTEQKTETSETTQDTTTAGAMGAAPPLPPGGLSCKVIEPGYLQCTPKTGSLKHCYIDPNDGTKVICYTKPRNAPMVVAPPLPPPPPPSPPPTTQNLQCNVIAPGYLQCQPTNVPQTPMTMKHCYVDPNDETRVICYAQPREPLPAPPVMVTATPVAPPPMVVPPPPMVVQAPPMVVPPPPMVVQAPPMVVPPPPMVVQAPPMVVPAPPPSPPCPVYNLIARRA